MKRLIPILMALPLLAGCAGLTSISTMERDRFTSDQFALAAADGPLRAVVRNNPFAADRDDARLLASVAASSPLAMRLDKAPAGRKFDYRLVVQFGAREYRASVAGGAVDVCRDDAAPQPVAATGPIDFAFAFCLGERSIAQAHGMLARPASPDDPGFRRAAGLVLAALLLPGNHMMGPGNGPESLEPRR